MGEIKVFAMSEYEWVAGRTAEEVKAWYIEEIGLREKDIDEGYPRALTEAEMGRFTFYDGERGDEDVETMTFKEQLRRLVGADPDQFPCIFAEGEE